MRKYDEESEGDCIYTNGSILLKEKNYYKYSDILIYFGIKQSTKKIFLKQFSRYTFGKKIFQYSYSGH